MTLSSGKGNLGGFSFEIAGEARLSIAISRMTRAVDDLRPFGPAFKSAFEEVERQQFGSTGAAGRSGAWAQLTEPYATRKRAKWGSKPILRASDALMKALTGQGGNTLLISEPHLLGLGTTLGYGIYHQTGTARMVARQPISIGPKQDSRVFGKAIGEMARQLGYMWTGQAK